MWRKSMDLKSIPQINKRATYIHNNNTLVQMFFPYAFKQT
jgi:hypothetical protein